MQTRPSLIVNAFPARPCGVKRGFGTVCFFPFASVTVCSARYCSVAWPCVALPHGPAHSTFTITGLAGRSVLPACIRKLAPRGASTLTRPLHPAPSPAVHVSFHFTSNSIRVAPAPKTWKLLRNACTLAHLHGGGGGGGGAATGAKQFPAAPLPVALPSAACVPR